MIARLRARRARRARGDRGSVVLEAALVMPIFLTAVLGLCDLGYGVFQTSQASSAARDGARVAIINHSQADVAGSSDNTLVQQAVTARLAGQTVSSITVTCISGQSGSTVIACSTAQPDLDRVRVVVTWSYRPITPAGAVVGTVSITGTATMGILGAPVVVGATTTTSSTTSTTTTTTTTPPTTAAGPTTTTATTVATTATTATTTTTTTTVPGQCAVTGLNISPGPSISQNGANKLNNDETFTVTTNNAATCTNLKLQLPKSPTATVALISAGGGTWTYTANKGDQSWPAGNGQQILVQSSSGTTLPGGSFTVNVT